MNRFNSMMLVALGASACANVTQDASSSAPAGPLTREERARAFSTPANSTSVFSLSGSDVPMYGGARLSFHGDELSLYVTGMGVGQTHALEMEAGYTFAANERVTRDGDGGIRVHINKRANFHESTPRHVVFSAGRVVESSSSGRFQRFIGYRDYEFDLRIDRTGLYVYSLTGEWVEQSLTEVVPTGRRVTLTGTGRITFGCGVALPVATAPGASAPGVTWVPDVGYRRNLRCRELFGEP